MRKTYVCCFWFTEEEEEEEEEQDEEESEDEEEDGEFVRFHITFMCTSLLNLIQIYSFPINHLFK